VTEAHPSIGKMPAEKRKDKGFTSIPSPKEEEREVDNDENQSTVPSLSPSWGEKRREKGPICLWSPSVERRKKGKKEDYGAENATLLSQISLFR